jgi:hypothetical protein
VIQLCPDCREPGLDGAGSEGEVKSERCERRLVEPRSGEIIVASRLSSFQCFAPPTSPRPITFHPPLRPQRPLREALQNRESPAHSSPCKLPVRFLSG